MAKSVAVDVNPATREVATGTEIYTREVATRLPVIAPDLRWSFFASRAKAGLAIDVMVVPLPRLWSQLRLPAALARTRPDLLFVPAHAIPFAWPGRTLTVVHDLAFEFHPKAYSPAEAIYLRMTTRWAALRCPVLITVSESTKSDLVRLYGVKPDRVRVIAPGGGEAPNGTAASATRLKELGVDGDFVLQVGRIEARKNQPAALAAVEKLENTMLVVAGPERDPAIAARLRASKRCRVLGLVDAPTLDLLYQRARAVVVPSLYEGFGLPVIEAMSRGQVVVAARNSSLPEAGGDAAIYVDDPNQPDLLAKALAGAMQDGKQRTELVAAARKRAAEFTWDRCAKGVADVIREVLR